MSEQAKCPKCGANVKSWNKYFVAYECGTKTINEEDSDDLAQSDRCKITVLQRDNAALRAMLERVRDWNKGRSEFWVNEIDKLLKEAERE